MRPALGHPLAGHIAPKPQPRRRLGLLLRGHGSAVGRRGPPHPDAGDLAGAVPGPAQRPGDRAAAPQDRDPGRLGAQERRPRHGRRLPRIGRSSSTTCRSPIHGDGWTPIEVDLTSALDGRTAFVLGVEARVPDDRHGGRFSQSLAGKQDWYGVQGGIWKGARIEARDPIHIGELAVRTSYDLAQGAVIARGRLSVSAPAKIRLTLSRLDRVVTAGEFDLRLRGIRGRTSRSRSRGLVARRSQPLRPRCRGCARRNRRRRRREGDRLPAP